MVRVNPITPQSQFKKNSGATVPLRGEQKTTWLEYAENTLHKTKTYEKCVFARVDSFVHYHLNNLFSITFSFKGIQNYKKAKNQRGFIQM